MAYLVKGHCWTFVVLHFSHFVVYKRILLLVSKLEIMIPFNSSSIGLYYGKNGGKSYVLI